MTCVKCRYEYCWQCLRPWKVHGEHTGGFYECNLPVDGEQQQALGEDDMQRFVSFYRHFKAFDNFQKLSERRCQLLLASQPAFPQSTGSDGDLEVGSLFTTKGAGSTEHGSELKVQGGRDVTLGNSVAGSRALGKVATANIPGTLEKSNDTPNLGSVLKGLFHTILSFLTLWRLHCKQTEVAFCLMIFIARRAGIGAETLEVFFCSVGVTGVSTFMGGSKQVRALRKMIDHPTPLYVMINCLLDEAEIRTMTAASTARKKARAKSSNPRSQPVAAINGEGMEAFVSPAQASVGESSRANRRTRFSAPSGVLDGWGFSKMLPVYAEKAKELRSTNVEPRDISQYFRRAHSSKITDIEFPENWMDLLSACTDYETDLLATVDATLLCSCTSYNMQDKKGNGTQENRSLAADESKVEEMFLESKTSSRDSGEDAELYKEAAKSTKVKAARAMSCFVFDTSQMLFRNVEDTLCFNATQEVLPSTSSPSFSSSCSTLPLPSLAPSVSLTMRDKTGVECTTAYSLLDSVKLMTTPLHTAVCACCSVVRSFEKMEDDPGLELRGSHPLTNVLGSPTKFTLTAVNVDSYRQLEAREVDRSHMYKLSALDVYSKTYPGDSQIPGPLGSLINQACDFCGCDPILGDTYKCTECDDVNICANCYTVGSRAGAPAHVAAHIFVKRKRPKMHINFRSINVNTGLIPPVGERALVPLEKGTLIQEHRAMQRPAVAIVSEYLAQGLRMNVSVRRTARTFDGYRLCRDLMPPLHHEVDNSFQAFGDTHGAKDNSIGASCITV